MAEEQPCRIAMYRHAGAPKDARRDSQHFAAINTVPFTCNFNVVAKLGGAVLRCQQCVRRSRGWIQRQRTDVRADPGSVERRRQIHCGRVGQGRQDACMHACMAGHVHAAAVLLDRVRALRARLAVRGCVAQPTGWCWSLEPCWAARAPGRRRTPPPSARRLVRVASGLEPM